MKNRTKNKTLKEYLTECENNKEKDREYLNALREMGIIVFIDGGKK